MITTAIIPVAGYGTRRLPITKAIEKCMLPIGNRPIVDYVVADCIAAGITDIYFAIGPDSHQLQKYYSHNEPLEAFLQKHQKTAELAAITPPAQVNFHYVVHDPNVKYGSAVPVATTYEQMLKDGLDPSAPVAVLMGDDFIYRSDGSTVADLIAAYESVNPQFNSAEQSPAAPQTTVNPATAKQPAANLTTPKKSAVAETSVLLGAAINQDNPNKYGFLELDNNNNLIKITESLTAAEAPTNLINVSKYLMSPALLRCVADYVAAETTEPEYYLTTTPFSNYLATGHQIRVIPASGEYLDGGSLSGWLHANQVIAQ